MSCIKVASCGPVAFVEVNEHLNVVICGIGQSLLIYDIYGSEILSAVIDIFGSHSINGCTMQGASSEIILYGWKYMATVRISHEAVTIATVTFKTPALRDLILDCRKLGLADREYFVVGYAQNILEVIDSTGTLISEFRSPVVCVLFSLSFSPSDTDITVASGTAFGPIHIWNVCIEKDPISNCLFFDSYQANGSCSGHTGVIFRLRWSRDGSRIASASDDRSVRVWESSTGSCIFVGWGHICRVWDVLFVGAGEEYLVTCSEDACIKLWDWQHGKVPMDGQARRDSQCLCTMMGHTKHIWRLAKLNTKHNSTDVMAESQWGSRESASAALWRAIETLRNVSILSAGNDAEIKSWSLSQHCLTSGHRISEISRSSPRSAGAGSRHNSHMPFYIHRPLPQWRHESCVCQEDRMTRLHIRPESSPLVDSSQRTSGAGKGSRRDQGAAGVFIAPNGSLAVVVLLDGGIWLVDLTPNASSNTSTCTTHVEEVWTPVISCGVGSGVTSANVLWEREDMGWRVVVACTHPNETVSLAHFTRDILETNGIVVEGLDVWPTDGLGKGINVWVYWGQSSIKDKQSDDESISTEIGPSPRVDVIVAGVKGVCRFWSLSLSSGQHYSTASIRLCHLYDVLSGRGDIVTASLLFRASSVPDQVCIVLGDCRGNVSVTYLPSDCEHTHVATIVPSQLCVARAHGNEVVSCLSVLASTPHPSFCSLGHDGYMNIYQLSTNYFGEDVVVIASRLSCLPIHSPDLIVSMEEGSSRLSLYVGGYEASDYVVWDIHRKYQLLRIDAGGWKRPHSAVVYSAGTVRFLGGATDTIPAVTFAYLAPWDKGTVFKCVSSGSANSNGEYPAIPLHLGTPGHGKVAYCGALIPCNDGDAETLTNHCLVAVGAEDGTIKVFRTTSASSSGARRVVSGVADGLCEFVQEVHMPSHSSVRAIAHSPSLSNNGGIIVCGGGRLDWGVWRYDSTSSSPFHAPANSFLRPLYSTASGAVKRRKGNKKMAKHKSSSEDGSGSGNTTSMKSVADSVATTSLSDSQQDHRILAVASCPLITTTSGATDEDSYLIAMCDSRGVVQLQRVDTRTCDSERDMKHRCNDGIPDEMRCERDEGGRGVREVEVLVASDHPILCCSLVSIPMIASTTLLQAEGTEGEGQVYLAIFGDTTGKVGVWMVGGGVSTWRNRVISHASRLVFAYQLHAMGANCLTVHRRPIGRSSSPALLCACSGGDDQSIGLASLSVTATMDKDDALSVQVSAERLVQVLGASGSAVKGICSFALHTSQREAFGVASVGYDQRLSLWTYILMPPSPAPTPGESTETVAIETFDLSVGPYSANKVENSVCPLQWKAASIVNIGDVNSMAILPHQACLDGQYLAAIGEGFQIFYLPQ